VTATPAATGVGHVAREAIVYRTASTGSASAPSVGITDVTITAKSSAANGRLRRMNTGASAGAISSSASSWW
jgi:hypothetical protein